MTATRIALALSIALAMAGCARKPIDTGADFGQGGAYGAGGGAGGIGGTDPYGAGAVTGGTLPGSNISDRVLFAVDQTTLSAQAMGILDQQIGWLQTHPGAIEIEGHADERGTEQYNIQLGARRAAAVRDYMVSRGLPDAITGGHLLRDGARQVAAPIINKDHLPMGIGLCLKRLDA